MKLLLDTHAFIWAAVEPERLSARVRALVTDRRNEVLLSAVSAYEIAGERERDATLARLPQALAEQAALVSLDGRLPAHGATIIW